MIGWTGTIAAMLLAAQSAAPTPPTPPALSTTAETTAEPWLIEGAARTVSGRTVAPEGVELRGIDGLARWGDRIIAIQNGARTPRLLRLTLAPDWIAITGREALIEGARLSEPTTGYIEAGDRLVFVSRSQWTDFDRDGRPTSPTPAPAAVSRLSLSPELQP